jgi:hypothetical protein
MAYCSNCGYPLDDEARLCGRCGQPQAEKRTGAGLDDVPGWLGWVAILAALLASIIGIALYSFWAYRRGRKEGGGRVLSDEPYDNFGWRVFAWGLASVVPFLGYYAAVHLPTLCFKQGLRVGAKQGTAPRGFTSLPAFGAALGGLGLAVFGIAFGVGFALAVQESREEQREIDELFSVATDAYRSLAEQQAQIDSLYPACTDGWIEHTARNQVEAAHGIVQFRDINAIAGELEGHYDKLCTDGDIQAYCEAVAQSFVAWASEEVDPEDVKRGCLERAEAPALSAGSELQVDNCVVFTEATGEVRSVDCSEPHDGKVTELFTIKGDEYPGEEAVIAEAEERCPANSTLSYPTKATWNVLADRQVVCILEAQFDLRTGDCIIYSQLAVQRVSCSKPHDAEVIDTFDIAGVTYPGVDAVADHANQNCPYGTDQYLYPTEESWAIGDRQITCLDE